MSTATILMLALVFFSIAFAGLPKAVRVLAGAVIVVGILLVLALRPDREERR